jgi:radical SAM protein with 4Fe4S-binding SPASM domain
MHGYGEPLLSPYLFTNLDYLREKGFTLVDFSTNCLLLTEDIMRKLIQYKGMMNFVKYSINSARRELMEEINTGSNFDIVVANIQKFCDVVQGAGNPFRVWVQLMHTSKNLDEKPEELQKVIQRQNIEIREYKLMEMLNFNPTNELLIKGHYFWDRNCIINQVSRMFHWDGDYVGCCVDNSKSQVFGNVKDGIYSAKVQDRIKQLREEMEAGNYANLPACRVCTARRVCEA